MLSGCAAIVVGGLEHQPWIPEHDSAAVDLVPELLFSPFSEVVEAVYQAALVFVAFDLTHFPLSTCDMAAVTNWPKNSPAVR